MADEPQTTTDSTGITRDQTGQIAGPTRTRADTTPTATSPSQTTDQTEPKADADKSLLNQDGPGDKTPPKADDKPAGAPEAYTDFKVPDGFTLDETVAKEAGAMFKAAGLTQEQAQSFVDFYTAKSLEAFNAPFKAYQDTRKGWQDSVKSDREMGHRLPEIKTAVTQMLNTHLGPVLADQFREAMDITGVGDHPAFVRAFDLISQLLTEPRTHVAGSRASPFGQNARSGPQSAAQAMYPHLPSRDA